MEIEKCTYFILSSAILFIVGKTPDTAKWRVSSATSFCFCPYSIFFFLILSYLVLEVFVASILFIYFEFVVQVDYNDRPNAELIHKSKKNADLVIKSVDL